MLEKLLPTLRYSLHDNSEKVRTAFLDMLIKVKAVRAAKVISLSPYTLIKKGKSRRLFCDRCRFCIVVLLIYFKVMMTEQACHVLSYHKYIGTRMYSKDQNKN